MLLLIATGLLAIVSYQPVSSDAAGCIEDVILFFTYIFGIAVVGIFGIVLIFLGIAVLSTGNKIVRRGRTRSRVQSNEEIEMKPEMDPVKRQRQRTVSIISMSALVLLLIGIVLFI